MLAQLDKIQDDYKALIERKLNERIKEIEEKEVGATEKSSTQDVKQSDEDLNLLLQGR